MIVTKQNLKALALKPRPVEIAGLGTVHIIPPSHPARLKVREEAKALFSMGNTFETEEEFDDAFGKSDELFFALIRAFVVEQTGQPMFDSDEMISELPFAVMGELYQAIMNECVAKKKN